MKTSAGALTESLRKHELVSRDLAAAIRGGKLAAGQRLPNELELARKYNVSRNSVRRGLLRLRKEGLVDIRQGSGTYVLGEAPVRRGRVPAAALAVRYVPQSTESLIGHTSGPWWSRLREGLMYAAAYHGLHLVDEPCGLGGPPRSSLMPDHLVGSVVVAFGNDNPAVLMADLPTDLPKLLLNRTSTEATTSWVTVDRESGAYQATAFLLALGHRRIGFDVLGEDTQPARDRVRGYRRAYEAAGVPVDDRLLFEGASGLAYLEWPKRLHHVLVSGPRPSALLLHHDNRALHIMEVLHSHGIRVPQDLSLIIIDDDPLLLRMTPRLSCISEPYAEMGRRGVELILACGRGCGEAHQVALEPQLIMRESVLPYRVN